MNMIRKTLVLAAAMASSLLSYVADANAAYYYPPSDLSGRPLYVFVQECSDGIWIGWEERLWPHCTNNVYWTQATTSPGMTEDIHIIGGTGDDWMEEPTSGDVCGYQCETLTHNGYFLYLNAQGGNDHIESASERTVLSGASGDDILCGCGYASSSENYRGYAGTDYAYDQNGAYASALTLEGWTGSWDCECDI